MNRIIPISTMPEKQTSDRQRRAIDERAELNRKRKTGLEPIEIGGKSVLRGFADFQMLIILQLIEQTKIEVNKLENILGEIKKHENKKDYDCDFRSFDFLR